MTISESQQWQALASHADEMRDVHLRALFDDDAGRGERYTVTAADLFADYSKQRVTDETLRLLLALAEQAGLRERIDAMFAGERINTTEDRAVLHVALRATRDESIVVDGHDVVPDVHEVLDKMSEFARKGARGRLEGGHRLAAAQRHQHRHRRLRPRPRDGLRRAARLR